MRDSLFDDSNTLNRISNAMSDYYDKKTIQKVKDVEKKMDEARKLLTSL